MTDLNKKILGLLGSALAIIGLGLVVWTLREDYSDSGEQLLASFSWRTFAFASVSYALIVSSLNMAWAKVLRSVGTRLTALQAFTLFGTSQLAKYVPGNVMHLASRQMLGQAEGIAAKDLAKSSVFELVLQASVAACFAALVLDHYFLFVTFELRLAIFSALILILLTLVYRFYDWSMVQAGLWFLLFFMASGILFLTIVSQVSDQTVAQTPNAIAIIAVFVCAWLVGFVTPGAPAGIGVREWVLISFMPIAGADHNVAVAALLMRAITTSGDALYFISAISYKALKSS